MAAHEDVEFKTLDGLTLRGWLYPASKRGPGIIITPGVSQSQLQAPCIHFIARDQYWQLFLMVITIPKSENNNLQLFSRFLN
jgi:hypothetical protein